MNLRSPFPLSPCNSPLFVIQRKATATIDCALVPLWILFRAIKGHILEGSNLG